MIELLSPVVPRPPEADRIRKAADVLWFGDSKHPITIVVKAMMVGER